MDLNSSNINLILNSSFYLILLIYYQKKRRVIDLGSFILVLFSLSSIASILYYQLPYINRTYRNIRIEPFIYLFISILISIYPILKFNSSKIRTINLGGNSKLIDYFSITICLIGFEIFFEHLIQFIRHPVSLNSNYIGQVYAGDVNAVSYLSWIGRKINHILTLTQLIVPVLLFYYIFVNKRIYVIGFSLVIIGCILSAYNAGSRGRVIFIIMSVVSSFLIMRSALPYKAREKTKLLMIITMSGVFLIFGAMTLSRYLYSNNTYMGSVWEWVGLYAGEGFIRFNSELWDFKDYLLGKDTLTFLFEMTQDNDTYIELFYNMHRIQLNVFYTFVGDFVLDFGLTGALLYCFLINRASKAIIGHTHTSVNIEAIIMLVMVSQIFLLGFTAYIYRGGGIMLSVIPVLSFTLLLNIRRKFTFNQPY